MKKLMTAILAVAAIGSTSCKKEVIGNGPVVTTTRPLQPFTAIDLQMNGTVTYKVGAVAGVEIIAKESIHSILETNVHSNTLVIRYRDGKTYDADPSIRINVTAPAVHRFSNSNPGTIQVESNLILPALYLYNSHSGNVTLQGIQTDHLESENRMSGNITSISGLAKTVLVKNLGSGHTDISGTATHTAAARNEGSGNIRVSVSQVLDATIKGSGSIFFRGYPSVTTHFSGSGNLIRF